MRERQQNLRQWRLAIIGVGVIVYLLLAARAAGVRPEGSEKGRQTITAVNSAPTALGLAQTTSTVRRVVDGDTIEIVSGEKVRYIGINTPESVDPRRPVQCFGREAGEYNRRLVDEQEIVLKKDVSETDKYGRLLRYVYLLDGTFVNLKLVEDGYARADTFPPDVKFSKEFAAADRAAREAKVGLWSACK